jgi:lauroyl/myristoyl acyltransferase
MGARVAQALPATAVISGAQAIGLAASHRSEEKRLVVERVLRRVLGDGVDPIELANRVDEVFRLYARYYAESFRLPSLDAAEVDEGFTYEGFEHVVEAMDGPIGPILALPHLGGWEWAAFWLALIPRYHVTAVAEALEPPELFEWFTALREKLGMHVVPLTPGAGASVLRALKDKHVVCLLCDRYLGGGAVEVEFFGERTLLPAGPATLALRTGAPLLPTAVYFDGERRHGLVRPPLPAERHGRLRDDVARVSQDLARELEVLIRRAPEQWHLMQPNWPSDFAAMGVPLPEVWAAPRGARDET